MFNVWRNILKDFARMEFEFTFGFTWNEKKPFSHFFGKKVQLVALMRVIFLLYHFYHMTVFSSLFFSFPISLYLSLPLFVSSLIFCFLPLSISLSVFLTSLSSPSSLSHFLSSKPFERFLSLILVPITALSRYKSPHLLCLLLSFISLSLSLFLSVVSFFYLKTKYRAWQSITKLN